MEVNFTSSSEKVPLITGLPGTRITLFAISRVCGPATKSASSSRQPPKGVSRLRRRSPLHQQPDYWTKQQLALISDFSRCFSLEVSCLASASDLLLPRGHEADICLAPVSGRSGTVPLSK
jgi:hypothetical protein